MISYPLTLPVVPNAYSLERNSVNLLNISPYTLQQQVIRGIGENWSLKLNFAPQANANDAVAFSAFLSSLRGVYGTFYFGPPKSRLKYTSPDPVHDIVYLYSINNTLRDNITVGMSSGVILGVGTFITIGTQLVQILANSGGTTSNTIDIFPALRTAVPCILVDSYSGDINYTTPVGIFRQKTSSSSITFNQDHTDTFSIDAVEVV